MHLLIVLLQQLLGMLPGAKKALQPEAVRKGNPNPAGSEPDACQRVAPSNQIWMTSICQELSVFFRRPLRLTLRRAVAMAGLRAGRGSPRPAAFRAAKERRVTEQKARFGR